MTKFSRVSSVLALALCASASVLPRTGAECNTGVLQCCASVKDANEPSVTHLLGLLGIALSSVNGQVGLTCNPISVIGVEGNSCSSQPVCCTGNNFNGVVALGCAPVSTNI